MAASARLLHWRAWPERWRAASAAVLCRADFQRWAARFPLTRAIARRRALALFDLCAGFVYSQVLFACAEAGLLERLAPGPRELGALARDLEVDRDGLLTLLRAAQSLGLVRWDAGTGHVSLAGRGAEILGNPGLLPMIRHHALLYADLAQPLALLRARRAPTQLQAFWAYAGSAEPRALGAQGIGPYSELMTVSQGLVAAQVCEAYPFGRHRVLMDLGGGEGAFAAAVAQRFPGLEVWCVDLPAVARRAAQRLGALAPRARALARDITGEPLPAGADAITLLRVLHDHDDAAVERLLRGAHAALSPGGTLVIAEPMAARGRDLRVAHAYFGMYLLAMGSGRPRSPAEIAGLLRRAGFVAVTQRRTSLPLLVRIVTARKPATRRGPPGASRLQM
ncbi:MAG: methyltransferase [Proteobacteria bacterium]|nr:methyltransferase [Pseudomonadota bacterium]